MQEKIELADKLVRCFNNMLSVGRSVETDEDLDFFKDCKKQFEKFLSYIKETYGYFIDEIRVENEIQYFITSPKNGCVFVGEYEECVHQLADICKTI